VIVIAKNQTKVLTGPPWNGWREKMKIDEMGYVEEMRQRLGLAPNDTSMDAKIEFMPPMQRVGLITGWEHGSESWAETYREYFESQGLYLTTDPNANGVLET